MVEKTLNVSLGERSYPIYIGRGMVSLLVATLEQHKIEKNIVIITDRNVARHHLKPVEKHLRQFECNVHSIIIPAGEQQKNLRRANSIYTKLLRQNVGRKSTILALGGGVVGDLAGFIAATYHRGVGFVQMPTTLLSQVDSSVGGKVAVNHPLGKNMIGAFFQPAFVWTDMEVLATLPLREIVCGLGEIVKYGIIRDAELFEYLEENVKRVLDLDDKTVAHIQERCCTIKAEITSKDERETGLRMILNYGHTVGHALEAAGNYKVLKHGEAVLLGMVAEAFMAKERKMISGDIYNRIVSLISLIPLQARYQSLNVSAVVKAMIFDKKTVSGRKRFMLPTRIGEVVAVEDVSDELIRESIELILKKRWRAK